MALTEENVYEALKNVIDPELFVNIVDLGLIYNVAIEAGDDGKEQVNIEMTMTSPCAPPDRNLWGIQKKKFPSSIRIN